MVELKLVGDIGDLLNVRDIGEPLVARDTKNQDTNEIAEFIADRDNTKSIILGDIQATVVVRDIGEAVAVIKENLC